MEAIDNIIRILTVCIFTRIIIKMSRRFSEVTWRHVMKINLNSVFIFDRIEGEPNYKIL